jgi:hypothetical protein
MVPVTTNQQPYPHHGSCASPMAACAARTAFSVSLMAFGNVSGEFMGKTPWENMNIWNIIYGIYGI